MLSVSLCNSVQFRHLYRKLLHRNRRNSMRKSRIKSYCVWLKYLIWIWFLGKKDQIYTLHCSKQTLTTLKNLNYWQLLSLPLTYWGFKQSLTIWFLLFRKRLRKKKKKKKKKTEPVSQGLSRLHFRQKQSIISRKVSVTLIDD